MRKLPKWTGSLLVRTDFSDDRAWADLVRRLGEEDEDGLRAYVEPVDDRRYREADWSALRDAVPENPNGAFVLFVADGTALQQEGYPILVVDLGADRLTPFRCIAAELWSVENNLNLANMDWEDFADAADQDGVFRGFGA